MEYNKSMPIITLRTGVTVANFSSPHPFTFTDTSVLPACSDDRSRRLSLSANETITDRGRWKDIELKFEMTRIVSDYLDSAFESEADIVIVPLPVLQAMKSSGMVIQKARTIRMADRITKVSYATHFCV